jgi:3-deoxy-D-manno-octulosonate 8-phosphate phosphatase (KDO 8-P phosphatase)
VECAKWSGGRLGRPAQPEATIEGGAGIRLLFVPMPDATKIRMIVTDVDGVLTDGRIIYTGLDEIKEFNVRDGLAFKLAQRAGISVAVVSSRSSRALERRCLELGVSDLRQGTSSKAEEVRSLMSAHGLEAQEICYLGDDLPDLAPMMEAGISCAPADAAPEVLARATWKLTARGGRGALRELVERLLRERRQWDAVVREFESGKPQPQSI